MSVFLQRNKYNILYQSWAMLMLLVVFPLCVHSQYDAHLTGHVLDSRTGEHLSFVNVQLKGTNIGCVTDQMGHYFLKDLPIGKQTIVFSFVGYQTLELPVEIVADKTVELKAALNETSFILENVVVSANKYETKQKEAASIVNVVSPIVFETSTSVCMAEALGYQTGLRVEQTCANCGQTELRINGLEGQYSEILLDSRPLFSSLAGVYSLEQIPIGMVDRVEVVRGGGSALFGSSAISGVVNIITKEPSRNFVNISNTSQMLRHSAYDINTSLNASVLSENQKIGAFLFGVQRNRKQYDRNNDGFSDIPRLNSTTLGTRLFFKTSLYSKLTIDYHHLTDFRRGGNQFSKEPHEADVADQLRHQIDAGGLTFDWFSANNRHFLTAYSTLQSTRRESYFGTAQDLGAYGRTNDITSVTGAQYRFSYQCGIMPTDLSAGLEYTYNGLSDRMVGYNRQLDQTVHIYGGYLQNEWKNSVWSLLVGGRLEKHNMLQNPIFAPRVSARYTPHKNIILRASYANGYRAPQAYDEDLHVDAVGGVAQLTVLDPNLRPEYSHSLSVSTDLYYSIHNWEFNLMLEGFYTYLKDVFVLKENGTDQMGNSLLLRTNADGAYVGGLNVEGKLTYRTILNLQFGYTFQQSRYTQPYKWSDDNNIAPQRRMLRTPDNYAYMLFNITPVHDFTISLTGKATGSMLVPHFAGYIAQDEQVRTKSFWEFGLKAAYQIHLYKHYQLELFLGIKNLFDQYQTDLDVGPDRDSDYIYGPTLPRTYFAGFQLKL